MPRQNWRYVPDDIFKWIFLNENVWIFIKISLKFISKGPVNNIPALVQIMPWRRPGDKPFLNQWWLFYWRIYASFGLNKLTVIWRRGSWSTLVKLLDAFFIELKTWRQPNGGLLIEYLMMTFHRVTRCGILTSYGDTDRGQHWIR